MSPNVDPSTMARVIAFVERVLASETCEWDGKRWDRAGWRAINYEMFTLHQAACTLYYPRRKPI